MLVRLGHGYESRKENLKILVALRTNIFRQLDYGAEKYGYQEEKIQGMVLPLRWTREDLRGLLEQRVIAASEHFDVKPPLTLDELLPNVNRSRGDALDFILDRTLMRPRDAIMYLNAAVREGGGRRKLSWDDIRGAEQEYSKERLRALRDEWKDPYLDIDQVLEVFRGSTSAFGRDRMSLQLDEVAMVLALPDFRGGVWLTQLCDQLLFGSGEKSWVEQYGKLVTLLYDIGFIGISENTRDRPIFSYESDAEIDVKSLEVTDRTRFVIHPAFRAALSVAVLSFAS